MYLTLRYTHPGAPRLTPVISIEPAGVPDGRHAFSRFSDRRRSQPVIFSARRSPPPTRCKETLNQPIGSKNAHDAKRPRRPRRRLGPPRPQHLLSGSAERRAGAHRAGIAVMHSPWLRRPGLRPAAADDRAPIKQLRPLHVWLVLRPDRAAADDCGLKKRLRPRWVRPGLHATATLLLPPEEGRARHVYRGERHVLEGDLRPHEPGLVPH